MSLRIVDGMILGISDRNITEITIPARIVTAIGPGAFANCKQLSTVVFQEPSAVKSIESAAFSGCDALCMIQLPRSLEMLWDNAFRGCLKLSTISFHDNLWFVGSSVFNACGALQTICFPNSVKMMDKRALYNCPHLKKVYLPRKVRFIAAQAESDLTAPAGCHVSYI
ncbi:leucine-rich repeat domain-containing protein [bacterium]|nr:leucine-rich repeat domain-containing protein [Candidatus Elulimicrobium humile]